jgi:hypothetical protein
MDAFTGPPVWYPGDGGGSGEVPWMATLVAWIWLFFALQD